ncbi:MAG: GWxTD domain-containing protein [Flavobacteriales bacterium]|nr:GWxTD domain-containing protein [Flavobacteriales bacterium]MBK9286448.1 GWxTD domain-containing protein [Flavobacteriales bacterium]MBL0034816.1 GWxTD domain-containing protein [Flavobacteriales bacterium]
MRQTLTPFLLGLALLATGCGSSSSTTSAPRDTTTNGYGRDASQLRLQARIYHSSATSSSVYFKLHTEDLLYKSEGGGGPFRANVLVTYEAYAANGSKLPLDSASTYVRDRGDSKDPDKELIGSMEMKRNATAAFTLKVTARDLNRDQETFVYLRVPEAQLGDRNDFLPVDARTGLPLFDDHLAQGGPVKVMCEQLPGRTLQLRWYDQQFKLPAPVFTEGTPGPIDLSPDSSYTITTSDRGSFELDLPPTGFVHITPDTSAQRGYTLFVLSSSYPVIRKATEMLPPLRYITSMQEWERISSATNKRMAVEKFWLDAAGDRERARDAIRAYYGRVESANRNFTSHVEGWRTDRGLVHIIFGPPSTVRRTEKGEVWTYGEENNLMSLSFNFHKRNGDFTDNDYVLDRDPMFKGAWYRNVESWRNGRFYQN